MELDDLVLDPPDIINIIVIGANNLLRCEINEDKSKTFLKVLCDLNELIH